MRPLLVGWDLDGVTFDFTDSLRQYLVAECGWDPADCPDATRWEFYEDWGLDLDGFLLACHSGADAGYVFTHGDPLPGAVEAAAKVRGAGHELHIVTDRAFGDTPQVSERATRAWLTKHSIGHDSLTFSRDKTVVPTDLFIDDKPGNVAALRDAGVDAYLLTTGANEALDVLLPRVGSVGEFADLVLARGEAAA